jgi:drug/metabolite transporter (DMT)-like permease
VAVVGLLSRSTAVTGTQRRALWFGFLCVLAAMAFLGLRSIFYDFHGCFYTSGMHPNFTPGRLMLGALIPFLLLYLYGLDHVLCRVKNRWIRPLVLAGMILFMLISETLIDRRLFPNAYNWFHL